METIPLRPVFENERFSSVSPIIQLGILKVVYQVCQKNLLEKDYGSKVRLYSELNDRAYYRYKDVIISILNEVIPKVAKAKNKTKAQVINGHKAKSKIAAQLRLQRRENATFSDKIDTHEKFTPVSSPAKPYNPGTFDPISVQKAKDNNATGKKRVFYDKPKD